MCDILTIQGCQEFLGKPGIYVWILEILWELYKNQGWDDADSQYSVKDVIWSWLSFWYHRFLVETKNRHLKINTSTFPIQKTCLSDWVCVKNKVKYCWIKHLLSYSIFDLLSWAGNPSDRIMKLFNLISHQGEKWLQNM